MASDGEDVIAPISTSTMGRGGDAAPFIVTVTVASSEAAVGGLLLGAFAEAALEALGAAADCLSELDLLQPETMASSASAPARSCRSMA